MPNDDEYYLKCLKCFPRAKKICFQGLVSLDFENALNSSYILFFSY